MLIYLFMIIYGSVFSEVNEINSYFVELDRIVKLGYLLSGFDIFQLRFIVNVVIELRI